MIDLILGSNEYNRTTVLLAGVKRIDVCDGAKCSSSFPSLDIHALFQLSFPRRLGGEFSNVKGNGNPALTALDNTFNLLL